MRTLCFLALMTVSLLANGWLNPAFGLSGGQSGAPGRSRVIRADGFVEPLRHADCAQLNA
ncbi:MAG: hypothetical protein ACSLEN_07075 [Candidatus Malihini olakiniferum]